MVYGSSVAGSPPACEQTRVGVTQLGLWGAPGAGGSAVLSADGVYRYHLSRVLPGAGVPVHFVMLNPSTADAGTDDATIRRCLTVADATAASSLHVWNLFAFIATRPADLPRDAAAVGPGNLAAIRDALAAARAYRALVIAAWGATAHPLKDTQARFVRAAADAVGVRLHALRVLAGGHPAHPGRLPAGLPPTAWPGPPAPAAPLSPPREGDLR